MVCASKLLFTFGNLGDFAWRRFWSSFLLDEKEGIVPSTDFAAATPHTKSKSLQFKQTNKQTNSS